MSVDNFHSDWGVFTPKKVHKYQQNKHRKMCFKFDLVQNRRAVTKSSN